MSSRLKRAAGVCAIAALLIGLSSGRAQDISASPMDLLEYYSLRRFDLVARTLKEAASGDLGVVLDALKPGVQQWIRGDGAEWLVRRRLAAASFALEGAEAGLDTQWTRSLALLEWGCELLRATREVAPGERAWHLAALAVLEGARDVKALNIHLAHMQTRVPTEPRIALARAFVVETRYWDDLLSDRFTTPASAEAALAPALAQPESKIEAHLRAGYFEFERKRFDESQQHLRQVSPADDPGQQYLAKLFSAWILERRGEHAPAIASYRAALEAAPGAQTASFMLAVQLQANGEQDEARQIMSAALTPKSAIDPWRLYGYGDFRRYPILIAALRKHLQ